MYRAHARFRPTLGATDVDPFDWLDRARGEAVITKKGNVYVVVGEGNQWNNPVNSIRWTYRADGSRITDHVRTPSHPEYSELLQGLIKNGRIVSGQEATAFLASRKAVKAPTISTAPTTSPTFTLPGAPAPAAATKPRRKRQRQQVSTPIYRRTWFPFAAGGAALVLVLLVATTLRKKTAVAA